MKLTQAYLRKLIMEELFNKQLQEAIATKDLEAYVQKEKQKPQAQQPQAQQTQQAEQLPLKSIANEIEKMSEQDSPFIRHINRQSNEDDQLKVLQMFLNKLNIKNKSNFYTNLGNMAFQNAKQQAQPTGQQK